MKKAIISMVLAVLLLFLLITPAFANASPYNELRKKGIPAEYLDSLSTDMQYSLLQKIGDNDIHDIVVEKVTLTETNQLGETTPLLDISPDTLDIQILSGGLYQKGTTRINKVLVTIVWEWQNGKPSFRLTDAITVNWDNSVFYLSANSFLSRDKYRVYGSNADWIYGKMYENPAKANQGGIGYYTRLAADPQLNMQPGGETIFMLEPNAPMYKGTNNGTSINFNYTHNRCLVVPVPVFSKTDFSVSVTTLLFYDETSRTNNFRYTK